MIFYFKIAHNILTNAMQCIAWRTIYTCISDLLNIKTKDIYKCLFIRSIKSLQVQSWYFFSPTVTTHPHKVNETFPNHCTHFDCTIVRSPVCTVCVATVTVSPGKSLFVWIITSLHTEVQSSWEVPTSHCDFCTEIQAESRQSLRNATSCCR